MREYTSGISDDLGLFVALVHAPDGSGAPLCAVVVCHIGAENEAQRELEPLVSWGSPLDVSVGPMPYAVANTLVDAGYPAGALNYWSPHSWADLPETRRVDPNGRQALCPPFCPFAHDREWASRSSTAPSRACPVEAMAVPAIASLATILVITSFGSEPTTSDENIAWTRFHVPRRLKAVHGGAPVRQLPGRRRERGGSSVRLAYGH
jgi:hypothetical protein